MLETGRGNRDIGAGGGRMRVTECDIERVGRGRGGAHERERDR